MGDLLKHDKIGTKFFRWDLVRPLHKHAASELGVMPRQLSLLSALLTHTPEALGVMGIGFKKPPTPIQLESVLALIGGTSFVPHGCLAQAEVHAFWVLTKVP